MQLVEKLRKYLQQVLSPSCLEVENDDGTVCQFMTVDVTDMDGILRVEAKENDADDTLAFDVFVDAKPAEGARMPHYAIRLKADHSMFWDGNGWSAADYARVYTDEDHREIELDSLETSRPVREYEWVEVAMVVREG